VSQRQTDNKPELLVNVCSPAPIEQVSSRISEALQCILGLQVDVTRFYTLAEKDHLLSPLAQHFLGLKPPRFPSLFEALLTAFACQQVSLDVGIMLLNRLTATYGPKFDDGQTVFSAFPEPAAFANASVEHIRVLGFSRQKA